ncbi:MAG TPA: nicotinate-nucleotide adenylyltransferase [Thermodesulfovibrionales bacterium]|nr:nicotinate-nucleotide adenylyltransferase [Thermodesulfovibrionales bacterium]
MISQNKKKIAVMGGAFNPIHYGHLRAAEEVRIKFGFERVLFIPSGNPPLKIKDLADATYRYEMTRLSIDTNPFFDISDIEYRGSRKSYTVDTLAVLGERYPDNEFFLILGSDSFFDIPAWYQPERLMKLANFVVVSRPGFCFLDLAPRVSTVPEVLLALDSRALEMYRLPLESGRELLLLNITPMDISATAVRALVKEGKSIKYLLPEKVESYIILHKLYREGSDHL